MFVRSVSDLTRHAAVSAKARVEFAVDQCRVEQPLAKQVEDAVDLGPRGGGQGPRLGARLVGAGQRRGRGGGLV